MANPKTVLNSIFGRFVKKNGGTLGLLPGEVKKATEVLRDSTLGLRILVEENNTEAVFNKIQQIAEIKLDYKTVKPYVEQIMSCVLQDYSTYQGVGYLR